MNMEKSKRRAMFSWASVAALVILCAVLAVLQYRWIGEVSVAERERMRGSLQASLYRLSQDFNGEITLAVTALMPDSSQPEDDIREGDYAARYARWKESSRHGQLIRSVALAVPEGDDLILRNLDFGKGTFSTVEWPDEWEPAHDRLAARLSEGPRGRRPPRAYDSEDGVLIEVPRMRRPPPGDFPNRFGPRREAEWLLVELNLDYIRDVVLPEVLQRHLGSGGHLDYQVEVMTRGEEPKLIYHTSSGQPGQIASNADASANLFELQFDRIARRIGFPGGREMGRGRGDWGRWQIAVRHRAGSLEAVVALARWRNLAVIAGILVLMLATVAALVRFTRQAQRLADLQMEFVAGVSHEVRTPLAVIRTAGYNLRGKVANNPAQVERYGALIQEESEKLTALVEQVLRFSSAKAGRVIGEREPVSIEALIDEGLDSSRMAIEQSHAVVEKRMEPGLPLVLGDPVTLKHAFQNLLSNAAKYGTEGGNWIGISAQSVEHQGQTVVEVRVADHGPGIPHEEQSQIFDPFYRGKRAIQDQIHGTGLGLSLVKGIVEAHGGTISVHSEPMKGTEFVVRIPAAPVEQQDEFTHSISRG